MNTEPDEQNPFDPKDVSDTKVAVGSLAGDENYDGEPVRRQSLRDRANAPSDTVGTGSYAAVTCSVLALMMTALLIAGLLLSRWLF